MTPFQQGQAAYRAEGCRFENPFPMGSADFAGWRKGWDTAVSSAVFERLSTRGTRRIGDHNMNFGGR